MAAIEYDLDGDRGGTIRVSVAVTESDGTVADLTGYTGEMQARSTADSEDVLAEGTVTVEEDTGLVTGEFAPEETADADWHMAVYDLRITDGSAVEYLVRGRLRLRPTVTR